MCNALGEPNKLLMKKYSRNNAKGTKRHSSVISQQHILSSVIIIKCSIVPIIIYYHPPLTNFIHIQLNVHVPMKLLNKLYELFLFIDNH